MCCRRSVNFQIFLREVLSAFFLLVNVVLMTLLLYLKTKVLSLIEACIELHVLGVKY